MNLPFTGLSCVVGLVLASPFVSAQPVCEIPISAYVTDATGAPLIGEVDVELVFYAEPGSEATPIECRSFDAVSVDQGWVRIAIDGCAIPAPADCGIAPLSELFRSAPGVWVEVVVAGDALGPRIAVGAVPFAFRAGDSDTLQGLPANEFAANADLEDHAADANAHHSATSDGLPITPISVTVGDTRVETGRVDLGPDANDELTDEIVQTLTGGGDADALHGHVSSGHGAGGCYSVWGASSCIDGYAAASTGITSVFFWSGGAGAQPFCLDSTSVESVNPGWPGSGYFGFLTVSNAIRTVTLATDDLPCVLCCPE